MLPPRNPLLHTATNRTVNPALPNPLNGLR